MRNVVAAFYTVNQKVQRMAERHIRGFQNGMRKAGYHIFQLSQVYVPVSEFGSHGRPPGWLKGSGVMKFAGRGASFTFTISYTADYAIYVHERLDQHHEPPTSAKFLEKAMRESRGYVNTVVVAAIRAG
jgi:hypothetical protein